jgi:hypothetical protein
VGVYRQGFAEALVAVARLDSYMPKTKDGKPSGMWGTMPDVMLAKVAESLALRKAFPNDLSGIYTTEEMEQADAKQPPVAAAKAELPYDELMAIVKQINGANTREELLALWNAHADHMDQTWENSLGVDVCLRQFITARNQDIQAGA